MDSLLTLGIVATPLALALGVLYVAATRVRDECDLHDLAVKCQTMRLEHLRRLKRLGTHAASVVSEDVEILEDAA